MYFHNKNRVKKLHLHSRDRFCLNFFSQSKNRAKVMKKHNALIRLLRKNHSKSLLFLIKTMHFHAKKHQNLAKKSFLAMQMVKHVIVHFRDEKSRKKSKLTHKNVEKHNPLIRLVPKCIEMFIFSAQNRVFLMYFHHKNLQNVTNSSPPSM